MAIMEVILRIQVLTVLNMCQPLPLANLHSGPSMERSVETAFLFFLQVVEARSTYHLWIGGNARQTSWTPTPESEASACRWAHHVHWQHVYELAVDSSYTQEPWDNSA
eukprot:5911065-Amphidinium_carterae.1